MPDIEPLFRSPLSGKITRDGITIEVGIFLDEPGYWRVFFWDHEGTVSTWDHDFATDQVALNEVIRTIESRGMRNFLR